MDSPASVSICKYYIYTTLACKYHIYIDSKGSPATARADRHKKARLKPGLDSACGAEFAIDEIQHPPQLRFVGHVTGHFLADMGGDMQKVVPAEAAVIIADQLKQRIAVIGVGHIERHEPRKPFGLFGAHFGQPEVSLFGIVEGGFAQHGGYSPSCSKCRARNWKARRASGLVMYVVTNCCDFLAVWTA